MWEAIPARGSPKIVAELAILGIDVAKSTVEKYRPERAGPPAYVENIPEPACLRSSVDRLFHCPDGFFSGVVCLHRAQRAASQETYVIVSGLLPSMANTPVLG